MAILKLIGFAGEMPKLVPRMLPDTFAQRANNVRLDDGALTPIRAKEFVYQFPSPPPSGYDTFYNYLGEWLGWDGEAYVAPGPVATDRLYITGDGAAPKMKVGATTYALAVSAPTAPLTAAVSGTPTSDLGSTRLYSYTWVTAFGEESEPAPVSNEIYWKPGQTVALSGFAATPAGRNITKQRIYRSQTSQTGTQLYLIAERNASTANYTDSIAVDAYQEALPSADWTPPPSTLTGLRAGPNGMMAAFTGKELYFCEPYRPHAWPQKYVLTMDFEIVGLGWIDTTCVVVTKGTPYLVSGSAPELMTSQKLELNLPCINSKSVVDLGYGVAYASHDGLVMVSSSGARLISEGIFTKQEWQKLLPATSVASQCDGRYLMTYNFSEGGIEYKGMIIFDTTGQTPFLIRSSEFPSAMFYDVVEGDLYLLINNAVYLWDAPGQINELMNWKSKLFVTPRPTNFGAILIELDRLMTPEQQAAIEAAAAAIIAQNTATYALASIEGELGGAAVNVQEVNGDLLEDVPEVKQNVSVSVYADRKLVATVGTVNQMARLPSGFLATQWEVEVAADAQISQITLATTGNELRGA